MSEYDMEQEEAENAEYHPWLKELNALEAKHGGQDAVFHHGDDAKHLFRDGLTPQEAFDHYHREFSDEEDPNVSDLGSWDAEQYNKRASIMRNAFNALLKISEDLDAIGFSKLAATSAVLAGNLVSEAKAKKSEKPKKKVDMKARMKKMREMKGKGKGKKDEKKSSKPSSSEKSSKPMSKSSPAKSSKPASKSSDKK